MCEVMYAAIVHQMLLQLGNVTWPRLSCSISSVTLRNFTVLSEQMRTTTVAGDNLWNSINAWLYLMWVFHLYRLKRFCFPPPGNSKLLLCCLIVGYCSPSPHLTLFNFQLQVRTELKETVIKLTLLKKKSSSKPFSQ